MANCGAKQNTVLLVGGGIGGLAAALGLAQAGYEVDLFEQAADLGEIGAGIQLGPNAFTAMDALGCGPRARARAVYTDALIMLDALDESVVGKVPVGDSFREYFGNPYAVIHRADIHLSIYEETQVHQSIRIHTDARIVSVEVSEHGACVRDHNGQEWNGAAVVGCDGLRSVVREALIGDTHVVSGHVVYRAVCPRDDFPEDLRWNAAAIWVGPNYHIVHYPLRAGEEYNIVITFHSREQEIWSVREGSQAELLSYFTEISPKPRQLLEKANVWQRWATADREPTEKWGYGRATLLGDAAHPPLQYMAQGACIALEDAVTLREALKNSDHDIESAFRLYEKARIPRTARVQYSARLMGRLFHASGAERLVRNSLWNDRKPEDHYQALNWLYGWNVQTCLD